MHVGKHFLFPVPEGATVEVIEVRGVSIDSGDVASDQSDGLGEPALPPAEDQDVSALE
jgi:hypothetical protein